MEAKLFNMFVSASIQAYLTLKPKIIIVDLVVDSN